MDVSNITKEWKPEYNIELKRSNNLEIIERHVCKYTQKKILVRDISELRFEDKFFHNCFGAESENDRNLLVWIDARLVTEMIEAIYVHELLHRVMRYQGFAEWNITKDHLSSKQSSIGETADDLCGFVGSKLEHPEIYRRMRADFNLDMDGYFSNELISIRGYLDSKYNRTPSNICLNEQMSIILAFEALYYDPPHSEAALKMIKESYPGVAKYAVEVKKNVENTNSTPLGCSRSFDVLKESMRRFRIEKYGYRFEGAYGPMWKCFEFKI